VTTLDPQLTIIRTRDAGADFYDSVIDRVRGSLDDSGGVMFHFSGTYADEFFSVSAYSNRDSAADMFAAVTGPQLEEVVQEAGGGPDISRDEFEIFGFAVHDDEELQDFRFTQPDEFVAVFVTNPEITNDRYLATTAAADFPNVWPAGLVIHVAASIGNHMGVFDVWHADADMASFYGDRIAPAIRKASPEVTSSVEQNPSAIELHSLYINSSSFEENRNYLRE